MESPPTLLDVRYYDQHLPPSAFKNKGFRGRVILFLNSVRFWLETYIQYQILLLGISSSTTLPSQKKSLIKTFFQDVREEIGATSTNDPSSILKGSRYKNPRDSRVITEEGSSDLLNPIRGKSIAGLVAEHTVRGQGRYGTRKQVVMEEAFSPVTPETTTTKE
jgi:hypothetical protein